MANAESTQISLKLNNTWKTGTLYYKTNNIYVKPANIYIKINGKWHRSVSGLITQDTGNTCSLPLNIEEA